MSEEHGKKMSDKVNQLAAIKGLMLGPFSLISTEYSALKNIIIILGSIILLIGLMILGIDFTFLIIAYTSFSMISYLLNKANRKWIKTNLSIPLIIIAAILCVIPSLMFAVVDDSVRYTFVLQDKISQIQSATGVDRGTADIALANVTAPHTGWFYTSFGPIEFIYFWVLFSFLIYIFIRAIIFRNEMKKIAQRNV